MAKRLGKLTLTFLFVILCLIGFHDCSYAKTKVLLPKVYQHLDIGVQLAYSGSDWNGRGLKPGSSHKFSTSINMGSEIKVIGEYPLSGHEAEFDFADLNTCSHNIPKGCDFATHYAPYSADIINVSAKTSGNMIYWNYTARLTSSKKLGVVSIVKKYAQVSDGQEMAKREIYGPLGGERQVASNYPQIYAAISDAIRQAFSSDLGDNELTLFYAPIVFKYQKYMQVEDLQADLDAPYSVNVGDSYTLNDISMVDTNLTVAYGILEKQNNGNWKEIARWMGNGKAGTNTGGKIQEVASEVGSDIYRFTLRTKDGQESSCIKNVVVTDGRVVEGKAVLRAPKYSYEGHEFKVYDDSEFKMDGKTISMSYAYREGLASNYYKAVGANLRRDDYDAIVKFLKRGIYPVTLEVELKDGGKLFDTKYVEILKTPYANVSVGGVQKQNRKQVFNAQIATSPGKPITSYDIQIKDLTTGEVAHLSDKISSYEGHSIKTRKLSFEKKSEKFSSLNLEFLTKYPSFFETGKSKRKFSYVLKVEDSKGDTDIQHGDFSVRPDMPPDVNIRLQDTFIRDLKSNFASIVAEDATKSDGDLFERKWLYSGSEAISSDGKSEFDDLRKQVGYKKLSVGTNQKVSWQKEGVGKFKLKLKVQEKWTEETLEEFILPQEHLSGEGEVSSEVINIAPKVSITPIESTPIDLLMVGSESQIELMKKSETRLQSELIEKGIDARISWVKFRDVPYNDDYYEKMADFKYDIDPYTPLTASLRMLCDDDYVYTINSQVAYRDDGRWFAKKPYQIMANSPFTGEKAWSFTVNEENCTAHPDKSGKYFLISCRNNNKTMLLDRKNGQYICEIPILIPNANEVFSSKNGNKLYFLSSKGIREYDLLSNTFKTISNNGVYLPKFQNGGIRFVEKQGQCKFFYCNFDLDTQEFIKREYGNFEEKFKSIDPQDRTRYLELIPMALDIKGNAVFSNAARGSWDDDYYYSSWYADLEKKEINCIISARNDDEYEIVDIGGITDERGEFTDCYSLIVRYNDALNIRRGSYTMDIYERDGKYHKIAIEPKTKSRQRSYMIYAKKNTKNNTYNMIKGAIYDSWFPVYSKIVSADAKQYKLLANREFAKEVMDSPQQYSELTDYEIFGKERFNDKYANRSMQTYLSDSNASDRLFKILKNRGCLRSGVDRYLISLGRDKETIAKAISNFDEKIEIVDIDDVQNIASKIEEASKKPVGMLLIKAKENSDIGKTTKVFKLDSNARYGYEYVIYQNTDQAEDVLKIDRPKSLPGKVLYKKVMEKQNFRFDYQNGFVTFGGYRLSEAGGIFGAAGNRDKWSPSCTLTFDMQKDGYMEYDLYCKLYYGGGWAMRDNGKYIENGVEILKPQKRIYFLKKGKHTIEFSAYSVHKYDAVIGIRNLEIGYLIPEQTLLKTSDVRKMGNGKFMIKGEFSGPLKPLKGELKSYEKDVLNAQDIKDRITYEMDLGKMVIDNRGDSIRITTRYGYYISGGVKITAKDDEHLVVKLIPQEGLRCIIGDFQKIGKDTYLIRPSHSLKAEFAIEGPTGIKELKAISIGIGEEGVVKADTEILMSSDIIYPVTESGKQRECLEVGALNDKKVRLNLCVLGDNIDYPVEIGFVNDGDQDIKISNFRMFKKEVGNSGIEEKEFEEFSAKRENSGWNLGNVETSKAFITKAPRQAGAIQGELVYKKGQLVRYKINYDDYEADPSKKQCFLYVHTPYNDGEHEKAFAILNLDGSIKKIRSNELNDFSKEEIIRIAQKSGGYIYDKPIEKFYKDGKYTVYHWQEDDTSRGKSINGNPEYDKKSNICDITFYIEGTSNAPWVKSIDTVPDPVGVGKPFSLKIAVDDIEKEKLDLLTEVYTKGKRIFVHKQVEIKADKDGFYPKVDTGIVSAKAQPGIYTVVCTVSDATSVGISKYNFVVADSKSIRGHVTHTKNWEANRQKYNSKVCGKEFDKKLSLAEYLKQKQPRSRGTNVFWAGEKFVLNAELRGDAQEVKCKIAGTSYEKLLKKKTQNGDVEIFEEILWDKSMKKKWAGKGPIELNFVFTAKYQDGETKQFEEKIILDDSQEFRKLHRKW